MSHLIIVIGSGKDRAPVRALFIPTLFTLCMSGPSSTSSASGSMTILFFKLDLDLRKAASQAKSRPTRRDRVDRYLSAGNRRFTNTVAVAHVLRHRQVRQAARFWGSSPAAGSSVACGLVFRVGGNTSEAGIAGNWQNIAEFPDGN
ncbi:hypothetical protein BV25DRAFT_1831068 [Artomyces pyxidatus]|uniref:Uncharacterized protein n=1 Tax=Artomyces pyxidatus TaxID=48021 RepID=A0ACB8SM04_9AGAM|nr:hypothetical protein BV25DRAFT_1831068 [Artomyces pyxidatus]